jgi:hypothetical protein
MKQKLLILILFAISLQGFSQAVAHTVPDITQCGNLIDLTQQTVFALGNQPQPQYTADYFVSLADANANTNVIFNPAAYISLASAVIYIRVTNTFDNAYATTSFSVTVNLAPIIQPHPDVAVCDSYILPTLNAGTYHSAPGGATATIIPASYVITTTMTVYIFAETGTIPNCTSEASFTVTIVQTPIIYPISNVTACESYTLPSLQYGSYYLGPNGTGLMLNAGDVITISTTVYVFAATGNCTNETSFDVYIISLPYFYMDDVNACDSFVLPALPNGYYYYTGPYGSGMLVPEGGTITTSSTLHIYGTQGQCSGDTSFTITIGNLMINTPSPLIGCDSDADGFASFNINSKIHEIEGNVSGLQITFYETLTDAETGISPIASPYTNINPATQIIYVRAENIGTGCYTTTTLQLIAQQCATISGTIRIDSDNNGCTVSDGAASNIPVYYSNSSENHFAYTNSQGQYLFTNVIAGNVSVIPQTGNTGTATPTAHSFSVSPSGNYTGDFCIAPASPVYDARVYLSASTGARPGFAAGYNVIVRNDGNAVFSGTATLTFDSSKLDFILANPVNSTQTSSTLTFDIVNLLPSQYQVYNAAFLVKTPPTANAGDLVNVNATVNLPQTDVNPQNNTAIYNQILVNSLDPNDIIVQQGPFIYENQATDDLVYTVRFQNTGSADAVNVRLENELDVNLDWSTFRPIAASHDYVTERTENGVVFRFNNINLSASSVNEAASHGYVIYSVKPITTLAVGEVISNKADIYFDFNAAIATNTVTTELISMLNVGESAFGLLKIYPNPASGLFTVEFGEVLNNANISLYDIRGKQILNKNPVLHDSQATVDVSKVQAGMYFVKIAADGKSVVRKLIVR